MSEVKFTKGPWEVRTQTNSKDIIPGDTHYVAVITRTNDTREIGHLLMVNGDFHICKFNPTKDAAAARKMATDANLIAAAPELYEALEETERYFSDADGLDEAEYDYRSRVRLVLAKARGETI